MIQMGYLWPQSMHFETIEFAEWVWEYAQAETGWEGKDVIEIKENLENDENEIERKKYIEKSL